MYGNKLEAPKKLSHFWRGLIKLNFTDLNVILTWMAEMVAIFTLNLEEAAIKIRWCFKCSFLSFWINWVFDRKRDIYLLWSGHSAALLNSSENRTVWNISVGRDLQWSSTPTQRL